MRATRKIINEEKGTTQSERLVRQIIHEGKPISDQKIIANLFNNLYFSISKSLISDKHSNTRSDVCNLIEFLTLQHDNTFPSIKWQCASTNEVKKCNYIPKVY
jgi:hypothetical protein